MTKKSEATEPNKGPAVLSNRARRKLRKMTPKAPRHAESAGDAAAAGSRSGRTAREAREDRHDGLEWLIRKGRLTPAQAGLALHYRAGYRDAGEVSVKSCLNIGAGVRSTGGAAVGLAPVEAMSEARRRLFIWRYAVLRGQVDMLVVMDGVCGAGHTVRYLAGGDQLRGRELEAVLKVALDMLVAFEAGPPEIRIEGGLRD